MKFNIKALLLSAFVLPGLGQLYKGERLKGAILIILVNLFLLMALFLVLQGLGPLIASSYLPTSVDTAKLVEQLQTKNPVARWLLGAFTLLWAYGSVDAAISRTPSSAATSRE